MTKLLTFDEFNVRIKELVTINELKDEEIYLVRTPGPQNYLALAVREDRSMTDLPNRTYTMYYLEPAIEAVHSTFLAKQLEFLAQIDVDKFK